MKKNEISSEKRKKTGKMKKYNQTDGKTEKDRKKQWKNGERKLIKGLHYDIVKSPKGGEQNDSKG